MTKEVLDNKMLRLDMLLTEIRELHAQINVGLEQIRTMQREADIIIKEVGYANEEGIEYSTEG